MPNPATGISHISKAPRNYMNMKMGNGLPCRWPFIEADIEAVDCEAITQVALCLFYGVAEIRDFVWLQAPPNGDMPPGHDE